MEKLESLSQVEIKRLIVDFREDCILKNMSEETVRKYISAIRIFVNFLRERKLSLKDADKNILREFLSFLKFEKRVSHKTLENYFSALSTFYDYLAYEEVVPANNVLPFRRRYLRRYKSDEGQHIRRLLSIEELAKIVNSILDPRDRAIIVLMAKTGIRRNELIRLDVDDIDWENYKIILKKTPKRSNRVVFFDDETALVLRRWLRMREQLKPKTKALFINYASRKRIDRNTVFNVVVKHSSKLGLRISPHDLRHWFTTWLRRNKIPREFLRELRGDRRKEAVDIYDHIDEEELRQAYLACVPKLGIT
ncbi:MAG: tyrosine-type recombinase/integrase [Crenarchaeota archaeon]|nr:tyrosine-type recombinase/integrase [Thermoproteota archaeon]